MPQSTKQLVLGLDLGMIVDYSALAVVECDHAEQLTCAVRHLQQFPLGTPYVEIATTVGRVVREGDLANVPIVLDITAIGPEVVSLFRSAVEPAWVAPVLLTAGSLVTQDEKRNWRVPKRDLVTTMQLFLQSERFKVAASIPTAELLVQELKTFRLTVPVSANPDALEWRERPHDDLVLATALACWWGQRNAYVDGGWLTIERRPGQYDWDRLFGDFFPQPRRGEW